MCVDGTIKKIIIINEVIFFAILIISKTDPYPYFMRT